MLPPENDFPFLSARFAAKSNGVSKIAIRSTDSKLLLFLSALFVFVFSLKKRGLTLKLCRGSPYGGVLFLHYNGKRAENFSKFCIVRLHNLAVNINSYIKTVFVVRTSVDIENVVIILAILGLDVKC